MVDDRLKKVTGVVVAVDGPAAAGKTTMSLALARIFAMEYLESGRAYRALALEALTRKVDPADSEAMMSMLGTIVRSADPAGLFGPSRYASADLRSPEVTKAVSVVAKLADLRDAVTRMIHRWANNNERSIIEGRDIGSVVFPESLVKFFLTAAPEVRARRRVDQERQADYEEVLKDVLRRDHADTSRPVSPLRPADGSVVIDTSELTPANVVDLMSRACIKAGLRRTGHNLF